MKKKAPEKQLCEWFALCRNPAEGSPMPHPAFPNGVPICARCRKRVESLS